jgi:sugar phosphate isomerase/epimerase
MRRLSLDHITAIDTAPAGLAEVASASGCDSICAFLHPMEVLPLLPQFDICNNQAARARTKAVLADLGVKLDLAYPFTLSARTVLNDFAPVMDCAADFGAGAINALVYDRDPARRLDLFGRFCDMAQGYGLAVAVEFYPPSQIATLTAALDLVSAIGRPGRVGVNVDLLHLMRSGGNVADVRAAPPEMILFAQVSDGPITPPADLAHEASSARMLCGEGGFDIAGFVDALPKACPVSVEIPCDVMMDTLTARERAERAVASLSALLEGAA